MQNQVVLLRGVLEGKLTKYCTCAAKNPGQSPELSHGQSSHTILELEPYMLEAYLGKKRETNKSCFTSEASLPWGEALLWESSDTKFGAAAGEATTQEPWLSNRRMASNPLVT